MEFSGVMNRKAQGFALIDLIFVCGIIGVLCSVALPRLLLAKQAAGTAAAIGSMRTINSAELTYALTCGNGFYAPSLTALGTPPAGSNDPFIAGGLGDANTVTKSGYIIQLTATPFPGAPATCNGLGVGEGGQGFKAAADPAVAVNPRFFATNASSRIFEDTATMFPLIPEVGEPPSGQPLR
jgi:type II secretory pathway pseudopilin PulG